MEQKQTDAKKKPQDRSVVSKLLSESPAMRGFPIPRYHPVSQDMYSMLETLHAKREPETQTTKTAKE